MDLATEPSNVYVLFGVSILVLLSAYRWVQSGEVPKGLRLPPGPPPKPLVGNAYDMPTTLEYETFTRWAKEYGNLFSVKFFNQRIIYVNSASIAHDLFEKRSALYSDRFSFPMLNDLMGYNHVLSVMRYGKRWRRHRKMFQPKFHPTAAVAYQGLQAKQARTLLRRLNESPDDFQGHLHHFAGAIIMEVVYGIEVLQKDDPYIANAEKVTTVVGEVAHPGTFLVDFFPFLKYVPEWIPGAGFRKNARIWRSYIKKVHDVPYQVAKKAFESGTAAPSYTALLLGELSQRTDPPPDEEDVIRDTAAVGYGAGAGSTAITLTWFVLAMILHPGVQKAAQAELDAVVGRNRLPTFEDRENLPYINALCHETHRWHPVAPLGIAHRLIQDDIYGDYFIPGGSIVIGNIWALLHEESVYGANPENFNPERFLKPGMQEFTSPAFGFGRRVCPGRHMADNSVFIAIASILAVFDIYPVKDNDGHPIPIEVSWTSGSVSRPYPFRCVITPRSDAAASHLLERTHE